MANHWKQQGVPHKGWQLEDVIDIREDGQEEWETEYETCMMCGNERIRYVHIVSHNDIVEDFRVGCVCAEKMTNDYSNPRRREKGLKSRATKRITWAKKQWKISQKGNYYLKKDEHLLLIFTDKKTNKFKVKIDEIYGNKFFNNLEKAKVAVFDGIEYLKAKGQW